MAGQGEKLRTKSVQEVRFLLSWLSLIRYNYALYFSWETLHSMS